MPSRAPPPIFSLIFSLLLVTGCRAEQDWLEFDRVVTDTELVFSNSLNLVTVDASLTHPVLVHNYRSRPEAMFNFQCQVKRLANSSRITSAQFCYQVPAGDPEVCHDASNSGQLETELDLDIRIDADSAIGFNASVMFRYSKRSNDGLYFCRLANRQHAVVSNVIELENDAFRFHRQLDHFKPVDNQRTIPVTLTSHSPTTLHCVRNSYSNPDKTERPENSQFYWMVKGDKLLKPLNEMFEFFQHPNGTLEILRFHKTRGWLPLVCLSRPSMTKYADYKLTFDIPDQLPNYHNRIRSSSPTASRITLREGPAEAQLESLAALYYSNPWPKMTTAVWYKDGKPINYELPEARSNHYHLVLPSTVNSRMSGRYSLKVTQVEPPDTAEFVFDVEVVGVAQFKNNAVPIAYRLVGQPVSFSAPVSGNVQRMEVYLDERSVPLNSPVMGLDASFKPLVNGNREVRLTIPQVSNNLTRAPLLTADIHEPYGTVDTVASRTYTVSFVAHSTRSASRLNSVLKVFRLPQLLQPPVCPVASSRVSFFSNAADYVAGGLELRHFWTVTDAIGELVDATAFSTKNETLVLSANATISGLQVRYRLQIFQPHLSKSPLFDSKDQPAFVSAFGASFVCPVKAEFPVVLVAIITGLLLVFVLVLLVVICISRQRGETYNIDKNERAMGHDPEAECIETETFLNYERQNEDVPLKSSRLSLTDDVVGENSDDGELDYGFDTASYSEEGSFIGQYSTRSKPSAKPNGTVANSVV